MPPNGITACREDVLREEQAACLWDTAVPGPSFQLLVTWSSSLWMDQLLELTHSPTPGAAPGTVSFAASRLDRPAPSLGSW